MGNRSHLCQCQRKNNGGMGQPLGLDELMIVNPGPSGGYETLFLGEDGTLYQVAGGEPEVDRYFLGEDGTVYEVVPP